MEKLVGLICLGWKLGGLKVVIVGSYGKFRIGGILFSGEFISICER